MERISKLKRKFAIEEYTAPSIRAFILASIAVLIACMGLTLWTWQNAKNGFKDDIQTSLNSGVNAGQTGIQSTVLTYGEILKGAAGLFKIKPNIDNSDWTYYFSSFDIDKKYPGLQALVYSERVPASEIRQYQLTVRGEAAVIKPSGNREVYYPARLVAPMSDRNDSVFGYDAFTEPTRRKAMEQARDSGELAVTEKITLVQDKDVDVPGLIIFVPVYKNGLATSTVAERREALQGYVSAGIRMPELVNGLFASSLNNEYTGLAIYDDKSLSNDSLLYKSKHFDRLSQQPSIYRSQQSFNLSGDQLTMVAYVTGEFSGISQRRLPTTILYVGTALSVLLSAFLLMLMINRARAIAYEKHSEVQEVKDELLSLASHQLRTPATSVKQYVGMVLEGFTGDVTKEQRTMLEKAYQGNERQLEIINQILYVTRADSGRLLMNKERLDLNQLIRDVIDEQKPTVHNREQKLVFKPKAKPLYVNGDRQYLSMAIDNLISNASKYSYRKGRITIEATKTNSHATLTVTDRGVGIDQKDYPKLFRKFSRIPNELSIEAGGSGIGLYLCKQIVALHGGTIEVDSAPGKGTAFTITLPRKAKA